MNLRTGVFFEAMLRVFAVIPDLPTVAHDDEEAESEDGAGLALLGMNGAVLGCICEVEMARTGGANGIGKTVSEGLQGKLSERKMLGNRTMLNPSPTKPGSAARVSINVIRDA